MIKAKINELRVKSNDDFVNRLVVVVVGVTHPYRGGIAAHTTRLCQELGKRHKVHCINFKRLYPQFLFPGKTQLDTSEAVISVPSERLLDSVWPPSWIGAARTIAVLEPDLVIFQWWHPFFTFLQATVVRMVKKKSVVIIECHNIEPHEPSFFDRFLTGFALRRAHALIVHSTSDETAARRLTGMRNIFRVNLPMFDAYPPTDLDRETLKREMNIPAERPVLLFFGYIRKYKGLSVLLEAMACFNEDESPLLLVAGEFYEPVADYLDYIEQHSLSHRVRLIPEYIPNEKVAHYFRVADALVLPYLSASQSGVTQIARVYDCPVVASRVGGLPDTIESPRTGILVEPNEPRLLFEALQQVLRPEINSQIRNEMHKEQHRYSWKKFEDTLLDIYNKLVREELFEM